MKGRKSMETSKVIEFRPISETLGKFRLAKKKLLIPEMNRMTAHLFAATFRSFGIEAQVLRTYGGLDLGKKYTSGKECYPCQVTLGDILCFAKEERERLAFSQPFSFLYLIYYGIAVTVESFTFVYAPFPLFSAHCWMPVPLFSAHY